MAELLMANGWTEPNSLGAYLREALPEDYVVLAEPSVQGRALDAVVVGPQGLFVMYARHWEGEVRAARHGPWHGRLASGQEVRYDNASAQVRRATEALRAFLQDEFPSLDPAIFHFLVLMDPDVELIASQGAEPHAMTAGTVVEEIESTEPPGHATALNRETREKLATALRDRRLTSSQRASQPFIFRSGGLFGSGKKVWTLRAAIRHMDRHPQDGIYHLRNGTLLQWLSDQGAHHLAQLAREVAGQGESDARAALETFLIGSGLVQRPRLSVRPKQVNLGFILSGETSATQLRVARGRGRGYLFGALHTNDSWLDVQPGTIKGRPIAPVVSVTAKTDTLQIRPAPYHTELRVESSASEEPVMVPVRFRIVGMPSRFNRHVLRPLVGLVSGGLLGAGVGWSLGRWALQAPGVLADMASPSMPSAAIWALLIGLAWAALGGIRGSLQRPAWPTSYATQRWLLRTLGWAVALSLMAAAGLWTWTQMQIPPVTEVPTATLRALLLSATACSMLAAVLDELRLARSPRGPAVESVGRSLRRPMLVAAIGILLAVLLAASAPAFGIVRWHVHRRNIVASVREWTEDRSAQLEKGLNGLMDQLYLRYYDSRTSVQALPAAPAAPAPPADSERP
jgi:hypothetical protein